MKKLIFTCIYVFLFAVASGANCEETLSNFRLGDATWGGFNYDDKTKEYTTSLNSPIVSFSYKTTSNSATGIQWRVDEYIDNAWKTNLVSESKSGTSTIQLSKSARKIRFVYSGNFAGDFSNIKITQGSYLELPTNDINFGVIEQGSSIPNKSITIEYSALNEDITASIDEGVFSIDKTDIASAGCTFGSTTLNVSFKPIQLGTFADEITFSNGTVVKVYGEYSRKINTTLKVVKEGYTSVSFSWDKVQDATAYRIVDNTGVSYVVDGAATEFNVTGLTMGTNYNFTLYAIFNGAISINGTSVDAKTKQFDEKLEDCVVFEHADEKSYLVDISVERYVEYALPNDVSYYTKRLEFEVKTSNNSYIDIDGDMGIYVLLRGADNYQKLSNWNGKSAGINEEYKTCVVEIPYNTISIKFSNGVWNGSLWRYVRNLKVFKDNVLKAYDIDTNKEINSLDFGAVEYGESSTKTFKLTYVNATKLKAGLDSDQFSIVSFDEAETCTEGTQNVTIKFTPNECKKDYTSSLSIFNGQDISITLTGSVNITYKDVNTIIWNGTASTEWDNRDNWYKTDGTTLTCADRLTEDLTVIIPAANSEKYVIPIGGITQYPVLPDISTEKAFKEDRNAKWNGNQVNAGDNATATKVADKIYMEYGAALVGVEGLNVDGVSRYNEVELEFTARRHDWLLVGPIVKPWDEANPGETRNIVSGDYYLNDLPHVYMHKAEVDVNPTTGQLEAFWDATFTELNKGLTHEKTFAISIPDQYGRNLNFFGDKVEKLPAEVYNIFFPGEIVYDGNAPHTYTFKGRFYNDSSLPTYTIPQDHEAGKPVIFNNSYPANIDAQELQQNLGVQLQYYDYGIKNFVVLGGLDKSIMSQHSFVFVPSNELKTFEIKKEWFETTETGHRNASVQSESFRIELRNDAASTASEIYVRYDALKDDEINYALDAPKIFNKMESSIPDLYTIRYEKKWAGLAIPTISEPIPLGVKVSKEDQTFTFSLKRASEDFNIILEDRQESKQYNLSEGEVCVVNDLVAGNSEGRFYLLLSENASEEGDDVTTDVEDVSMGGIDIYTQENSIIVSSTADIELMQVIVSDMAGRCRVYNVSGQYIKLDTPANKGVYTINVVGDKATKIGKIRLN